MTFARTAAGSVPVGGVFDPEQPPGLRDAFEVVFAPVGEAEIGAGDEVNDRAGDEHLARFGVGLDALGDAQG
jgi:hypothetical protein